MKQVVRQLHIHANPEYTSPSQRADQLGREIALGCKNLANELGVDLELDNSLLSKCLHRYSNQVDLQASNWPVVIGFKSKVSSMERTDGRREGEQRQVIVFRLNNLIYNKIQITSSDGQSDLPSLQAEGVYSHINEEAGLQLQYGRLTTKNLMSEEGLFKLPPTRTVVGLHEGERTYSNGEVETGRFELSPYTMTMQLKEGKRLNPTGLTEEGRFSIMPNCERSCISSGIVKELAPLQPSEPNRLQLLGSAEGQFNYNPDDNQIYLESGQIRYQSGVVESGHFQYNQDFRMNLLIQGERREQDGQVSTGIYSYLYSINQNQQVQITRVKIAPDLKRHAPTA